MKCSIRMHLACWPALLAALVFARFAPAAPAGKPDGFPVIDFEHGRIDALPGVTARLGEGGALKTTTVNTGEAHSGEWCVEIDGVNQSTQYGLHLSEIAVRPNARYDLSFYYRMSESFRPDAFMVLVFEYAGDPRTTMPIHNQRFFPAHSKTAQTWTAYHAEFMTDARATSIVILFRQEHVLPGGKLWLDDIQLRRGAPALLASWEIDPATAILSGSVRPSSDVADRVTRLWVMLLKDGAVARCLTLAPGRESFQFPLGGLTDNVPYYLTMLAQLKDSGLVTQRLSEVGAGHHRYRVQVPDGPQANLEVTEKDNLFYTFIKSRPWEGNRIGVLEKDQPPPAPWTPLTFDPGRAAVRTWNNTIAAEPNLGGLRISFAQPAGELTTEPISLLLNGRPLTEQFRLTRTQASAVTPNCVTLTSTGSGAGATVTLRAIVEFDGFVRFQLTLRPDRDAAYRVDRLSLVMKFPKDFVKFHYADHGLYGERGLSFAPAFAMREFYPTLWFGNFANGICWCTERLHPGVAKQRRNWLVLAPQPQGSMLTIHMVNEPIEVRDRALSVEFGLLPTPARPQNRQLRDERFRSGVDETLNVIGTMPAPAFKYFGYPELTSLDEFRKYSAGLPSRTADVLYYFGVCYAMETIPQMTYFKKAWIDTPSHSYQTSEPCYGTCTGNYTTVRWLPSWTDQCLYQFQDLLDKTPIRGAYWDTAFPKITEEEGQWSCPVFAGREFHKRVYVLLKRRYGDRARVISHIGQETCLPYVAFSDYVLNGEHFRMQLMRHAHYLDFASLDELRATMTAPFGPARMFLPQYWQAEKAHDRRLMSQVGALTMMHDALPFVAGQEVLEKMMRRKYAFGDLQQAVWYPYWQPNPYLASDNTRVVFSLYARDGELFVIPFNTTSQPQRTRLTLSAGYRQQFPQMRGGSLYDPCTDRDVPIDMGQGKVEIDLLPYSTKLVSVRR